MFLGLPAESIGRIGGGAAKRSGCVDIAILQSAHDKEGVRDFVAEYGQVIVDECRDYEQTDYGWPEPREYNRDGRHWAPSSLSAQFGP